MIKKISLGTVQFGQEYGIANTTGKVSKEEAFKIFDYAKQAGICYLDTAFAYGDSESIIGEYLKENPSEFKIASKLPCIEQFSPGKVEEILAESLSRMGLKKIYGYLLHRVSDILLSDNIWDSMVRLKNDGQIEKIGFSLYSLDELVLLLDEGLDFDIIQVPYSIFDQRFEVYFPELKRRGIEVYGRSVFLQGLYFLPLDKFNDQFDSVKERIVKLTGIAQDSDISVQHLCLAFVLLNSGIDKVVIGVDSVEQFKSNLSVGKDVDKVKEVYGQLKALRTDDENVILPFLWNEKVKTI